MMSLRKCLLMVVILCSVLASVRTARAVIMILTPLKQPLEKEEFIFVAHVKEVLPDKPAMVLTFAENLKGKAPFERLPVNLKGDAEAEKAKHTQAMLVRVRKDTPIIVLASKSRSGKKYNAFGFTNGTWFQMEGIIEEAGVRWAFLHCEPYLRRTFKGTTEELKQTIIDFIKDQKDPPAPNEKEPPGLGPVLKEPTAKPSETAMQNGGVGQLFGVIQLPFLGLIAGLAALFPTVFGGLAIFMKRWVALLSTSGLVSLIYCLYMQFPLRWISWTGIDRIDRMWFACAGLCAVGAIWAARRYRLALSSGKVDQMQPRKLDRIVLISLTVIVAGSILYALADGISLRFDPWPMILVSGVAVLAGTACVVGFYLQNRKHTESGTPIRITAETSMLWTFMAGFVFMGAYETGRSAVKNTGFSQGSVTSRVKFDPEPKWIFEPKENGEIVSVPCLTKDAIYISVFHTEGLTQFGRVYALDPKTGKELWRFGDDDEMKPVFCSPVYHDGKIYIGEGFHKDTASRMFCLDANDKGKKLWEFKTQSHTESTPCIADGKVVFGAGNDGIYCLDAKSGKELWHYTSEKGIHIDANPVIADGKVYAGSGFSQTHQVTRVFCLDLGTGKEVWGERVEFSSFGSPTVYDGQVFFGLGNSTFSERRDPTVGMVLCRDAKTGKELWNSKLPDTVLAGFGIDKAFLYVGCYDGSVYALHRRTTKAGEAGTIAWKQSLSGGPIVAGILAQGNPSARISDTIYALGRDGVLASLDPYTGDITWSINIQAMTNMPKVDLDAAPAIFIEDDFAYRLRRIYLGVGLSRGQFALPTARLYCFEEETTTSRPESK